MKVNTGKSHLLVSENVRATAKIDNNYIESEKEQVLLYTTIDSNLTFENHFNNIYVYIYIYIYIIYKNIFTLPLHKINQNKLDIHQVPNN